ncbi:hypothetical protein D0865_00473 [Hortaea werneckii]|uniref:Uncharacterized protein n=1 Tax=Hortaea werneckii TaxID=91943 RepID=A0A3M7DEH6_HORWE|nr:hypothetical protein D0865_00473 [Hortaea werneckii]
MASLSRGRLLYGRRALPSSDLAERWHQTLLTIAVVVSSVVFNSPCSEAATHRKYPFGSAPLRCFRGVFVVVILLWVMAP